MDNDGDQVMDGQVGQNVNVQAANPIPPEAIPPLLPGGIQMPPAAQPPIDPAVIDKGCYALRDLPKFDRTGTWRSFAVEFSFWLDSYNIYRCGDDFMKKALLKCFRGTASTMVSHYRYGSEQYNAHPYFWQFAVFIQGIFAPEQESQLAKSEFKSYKQAPKEDVSTYFSTKCALFDVAYEQGGDFETLFQSIIDGLMNKEVKYQLGSTYPRNREEIKLNLVRIAAAERRAYEHGYSRSETKDGLYHTTVLDVSKRNQRLDEEPMDISAMRSVINSMEEELLAVNDGKKLDKSKIRCHRCHRFGHFAVECRSGQSNYQSGQSNYQHKKHYPPQHGGKQTGKTPFPCNYCHKIGHRAADCRKKKKDLAEKKGKSGVKSAKEEEKEPEQGNESPYSRFLGKTGEVESN